MRLNTTQRESGLVLHLKFDEPTLIHGSKAMDSSGWGNHGTLSTGDGAVNKSVAGKLGRGLSFDGSNDYVGAGSLIGNNVGNAITISAWIYPTVDSNFNRIINIGDVAGSGISTGWDIILWNDNRVNFYIGDGIVEYGIAASQGTPILSSNNWYFICVTYANGLITYDLYSSTINKHITRTITPIGSFVTNKNLEFGRRNNITNQLYEGLIDDVRIYKRALSAGEVRALYENTKLVTTPMIVPKTPIPVIQQYRLNQGAR